MWSSLRAVGECFSRILTGNSCLLAANLEFSGPAYLQLLDIFLTRSSIGKKKVRLLQLFFTLWLLLPLLALVAILTHTHAREFHTKGESSEKEPKLKKTNRADRFNFRPLKCSGSGITAHRKIPSIFLSTNMSMRKKAL